MAPKLKKYGLYEVAPEGVTLNMAEFRVTVEGALLRYKDWLRDRGPGRKKLSAEETKRYKQSLKGPTERKEVDERDIKDCLGNLETGYALCDWWLQDHN